jgi:dihydroxyacetone kinase DhaKLM complex PTS-EIIA-like component DhaM
MTTTTTVLALDSYDTTIAIEANADNGMVGAQQGTALGADALLISMIIADQSEAYDAFRDLSGTTETQADAIKEYTDGYAVVAKAVIARELFEGTSLATDSGSTMTNTFCVTG